MKTWKRIGMSARSLAFAMRVIWDGSVRDEVIVIKMDDAKRIDAHAGRQRRAVKSLEEELYATGLSLNAARLALQTIIDTPRHAGAKKIATDALASIKRFQEEADLKLVESAEKAA
jgi:hypothetical protein